MKIARTRICIIATLCVYLLTCNAFGYIYGQKGIKIIDSNSPTPERTSGVLPISSEDDISQKTSVSNSSSANNASSSNSTHFLKYNNLGNSHNKAASTTYNFPEYPNARAANMQSVPLSPSYPNYYNPFYNQYYASPFGPSPYPQLTQAPSYYPYPYPQSSVPFSPSFPSTSPAYSWAYPQSSSISQQHFSPLSSPHPAPPIPLSSPKVDRQEIEKDSSPEFEDAEQQESKMVSSWFPSIPASDCEGIFEFTLEGTTNLQSKDLKAGNHKITIKMTSASPGSIEGQLWVDKKNSNERGSNFDIDRTFNNCRVVTASDMPSTAGHTESSSSLLNSLLSDLPEDDYSADEESIADEEPKDEKDESDINNSRQQHGENTEGIEGSDRQTNNRIAALE
jgi:hypothetical protein